MILRFTSALGYLPKRIVSLVPSQTLLLHALGLEAETVGITKFCVHPDNWFRSKTRVGGTKNVHPGIVDGLAPDLLIANYEENIKEQVEALAEKYPVWVSDVHDLSSALEMIGDIGRLTGKTTQAAQISGSISEAFTSLETYLHKATIPSPRTAYLIWKDPYMTAGGDTFIHDMLQRCGFDNLFSSQLRYPQVTIEELKDNNCELLLLSSEPYPFKEKHVQELRLQLPSTKILLVDGEMFSWYGSGLAQAPGYFRKMIEGLEV